MAEEARRGHRAAIEEALAERGLNRVPGGTVVAYVNHDRWCADCPCNGAELVTPGETMLCGSCGREHEVVFPDHKTEIEAVLSEREGRLRNWHPEETVDELRAQNIDHGILPDDLRGN